MAYLGLFTIVFASCLLGSHASSDLSTTEEDEGRFLFGTGTGTGSTASTDLTITGWETTVVVAVLFLIVLTIYVTLLLNPAEAGHTAYAATGYETDPYAAQYAPTGYQSPHHSQNSQQSTYSVQRSLEAAARKFL